MGVFWDGNEEFWVQELLRKPSGTISWHFEVIWRNRKKLNFCIFHEFWGTKCSNGMDLSPIDKGGPLCWNFKNWHFYKGGPCVANSKIWHFYKRGPLCWNFKNWHFLRRDLCVGIAKIWHFYKRGPLCWNFKHYIFLQWETLMLEFQKLTYLQEGTLVLEFQRLAIL